MESLLSKSLNTWREVKQEQLGPGPGPVRFLTIVKTVTVKTLSAQYLGDDVAALAPPPPRAPPLRTL